MVDFHGNENGLSVKVTVLHRLTITVLQLLGNLLHMLVKMGIQGSGRPGTWYLHRGELK